MGSIEFDPTSNASEILEVSMSERYDYIKWREPNARIERETLEGFAAGKFEPHKGRYGYRHINPEPRKDDIAVGEKQAERQAEAGFQVKGTPRKHHRVKAAETEDPRVNLVNRIFGMDTRNRL